MIPWFWVNLLRSLRQTREILLASGLDPVVAELTPRDGFVHVVVVGRKSVA